jgi:two-component system, response regulator / RNA-binding antiterminator
MWRNFRAMESSTGRRAWRAGARWLTGVGCDKELSRRCAGGAVPSTPIGQANDPRRDRQRGGAGAAGDAPGVPENGAIPDAADCLMVHAARENTPGARRHGRIAVAHASCIRGRGATNRGRRVTSSPLKILIIDESAARAATFEEGLREAGQALVVHRLREAGGSLPRIAAIDPDVILIGLENPSRDTLEEMFQVSRLARRPIAMFVDRSDSESVAAAIDAGVSAYVVDGLRKERVKSILDLAINRFLAFDRLQTELSMAKAALEGRKMIEEAKAVLMRQKGLSEEQAYALLRRTAMNQNRRIADLARSLVSVAELMDDERDD